MSFSDFEMNDALGRKSLIIFGAGGHAVSIANVAIAAGYKIVSFVDEFNTTPTLLGYQVVSDVVCVNGVYQANIAIAVGDNFLRQKVHERLLNKCLGLRFPAIVHPSAIISNFCEIAEGSVVMPGAVVGPNVQIGKFCVINTRASIDHDGKMSDYASLAPAVVTGGSVEIGKRSAVAIGAVIKEGVMVGDDCVVGASSYLNHHLRSNQVAYGVPAKEIRHRLIGESYLD